MYGKGTSSCRAAEAERVRGARGRWWLAGVFVAVAAAAGFTALALGLGTRPGLAEELLEVYQAVPTPRRRPVTEHPWTESSWTESSVTTQSPVTRLPAFTRAPVPSTQPPTTLPPTTLPPTTKAATRPTPRHHIRAHHNVHDLQQRHHPITTIPTMPSFFDNKLDEEVEDTASSIFSSSAAPVIGNASSLMSLGLLAVDLFLLRNVQEAAWADESQLKKSMLADPEVQALSSLFNPARGHRSLEDEPEKGPLQQAFDYLAGGLRAAVNLSRAYKASTNRTARTDRVNTSIGPTPIDCIWTLYCRNLDKTASINGPYGFLAKLNRLGLRLMMGEFPMEKAMEKVMREFTGNSATLNCQKLFPRCPPEEAGKIVMATTSENST